MKKAKAGVLPLYIKLYDDCDPAWRKPLEKFLKTLCSELRKRGLDLACAPACRTKREFESAVKALEKSGADALVTCHLAYSPSLESVDALAATHLPIVVLDTTPDAAAGPDLSPSFIMNNHGIHGVQDMCNLLLRRGKAFAVEAGHWQTSDVLDRAADHVRAARIVSALRAARVGLIGKAFAGMGDFSVEPEKLKADLGVTVVAAEPQTVAALLPAEGDKAVRREMAADLKRFEAEKIDPALHAQTSRAGLALRRWIEKENLTAFSLNFQTVTKASGIPAMPFLEISKAITRGLGYAGEGDTLTAALNGAVASVFPETSFTEMFCPDWAGDRIFLSHMGEINFNLAERKPVLFEKDWIFSNALKPVCAAACYKPGKAVFFNLAPQREGYALILVPVEMVSEGNTDQFRHTVRGWMKPSRPVARLLEDYSRAGGTHHAGLAYGDVLPVLMSFGAMMGFNIVRLD